MHTYAVKVNIFGLVLGLIYVSASLTSVNQDRLFKMAGYGHCPFSTIMEVDCISVRKYTKNKTRPGKKMKYGACLQPRALSSENC